MAKTTIKPKTTPQILRNLSGADMAKMDKQKVMELGGRDITKMLRLKVGKTDYFFSKQEKYDDAVKKYANKTATNEPYQA